MMMTSDLAQTRNYIERRQKRWHLVYYLRVFESHSGDLLGYLVDVTTEGMMLMSEKALPLHQSFDLQMEVPTDDKTKNNLIRLKAFSLWSKQDVNPHYQDTGFKLIEPTAFAVSAISELIAELKIS